MQKQRTGPNDTHPDVDALQAAGFRAMTAERKFALMDSLTTSCVSMARQAIRDAHPDLSQRERDLLFVEIHYGSEWAERLRDRAIGSDER